MIQADYKVTYRSYKGSKQAGDGLLYCELSHVTYRSYKGSKPYFSFV